MTLKTRTSLFLISSCFQVVHDGKNLQDIRAAKCFGPFPLAVSHVTLW